MTILYIGYWALNDGLTIASIKPHLQVLNNMDEIESILFSTIERDERNVTFQWNFQKVLHFPYYSSHNLKSKIKEQLILTKKLKSICKQKKVDLIICRTPLAGIFGYRLNRKLDIPYLVESFEPHSEYMREAGFWKKSSLSYWTAKYYEFRQLQTAEYIFTVSNKFKEYLRQKKRRNGSMEVIPCSVDIDAFKYNEIDRHRIRNKLRIDRDQVVIIYVGKFGGIYYETEAFRFFKVLKEQVSKLFLIILTPQDKDQISSKLLESAFGKDEFFVGLVRHKEVPSFLSASDLAICLQRSSKWSMAFSPIKNGEYWANGLPVLMDKNIGDDSYLQSKISSDYQIDFRDSDYTDLPTVNRVPNRASNQFVLLAQNYRSQDYSKAVYTDLIDSINRSAK